MVRILAVMAFAILWAVPVAAQDLGARARLDATQSALSDKSFGGARIDLALSQGVPWRLYTLTEPNRVVIDFREVDWTGADPAALLNGERFSTLRMGPFRDGWSRLVAEMASPMVIESAGLDIDDVTGRAHLSVELVRAEQDMLTALSGAPADPGWALPPPSLSAPKRAAGNDRILVVLDPGHGGMDPGAEHGQVNEADLMLRFAQELRDVLIRSGRVDVALTREADEFVSLEARVARAQRLEADLFISLHADALAEGVARGAAVYTLSENASDAASAALAERHNRGDLLAGVDMTGADDEVTSILLDIARLDNTPRSQALAGHVLDGIRNATGRVHKRPMRQAGFSVLKAAGIPSILLEVGFLSTDADLRNLQDPEWRAGMAAGIRDGILDWAVEDAALARLRRQ